MLNAHQPLALGLVFVMDMSDLGVVYHVQQQSTKVLPIQQAAGSDGTRAATGGADFTAGHLATLLGTACTA